MGTHFILCFCPNLCQFLHVRCEFLWLSSLHIRIMKWSSKRDSWSEICHHDEDYFMRLRQRICARWSTVQHQTKFFYFVALKCAGLPDHHILTDYGTLYFNKYQLTNCLNVVGIEPVTFGLLVAGSIPKVVSSISCAAEQFFSLPEHAQSNISKNQTED
jgi:hypothetical protein